MQATHGLHDGEQFITVFIPGQDILSATDSFPAFEQIVTRVGELNAKLKDGGSLSDGEIEDLQALFQPAKAIVQKFRRLSDRVTVKDGVMLLDGDPVHNTLAEQVLRFLDAGEDFSPLVRFYERLLANVDGVRPEAAAHSREQLYDWLKTHDFTITDDGMIVGYKGVTPGGEWEGQPCFQSTRRGPATVNDVDVDGYVPNPDGAVIRMQRSQVTHDPNTHCSPGLHVGTFAYAKSFTGNVLEVHVDPAKVVSVPTETRANKMRVCEYHVIGIVEEQYTSPVLVTTPSTDDGDEDYRDDEDYCDNCGDFACDGPCEGCDSCYCDGSCQYDDGWDEPDAAGDTAPEISGSGAAAQAIRNAGTGRWAEGNPGRPGSARGTTGRFAAES